MTSMTDSTTRHHPTPGVTRAGGEHQCIQLGAGGTPPVARNRLEAAFPMSAGRPKARDIEAIAMSSLYADLTPQYTRPPVRSAGGAIVERWAALVRRILGVGL